MKTEVYEPPQLNGYITVPEAAEILEVSRQAVVKQIRSGRFKTCRRVGRNGKVFVIRESEVERRAQATA